MAPFLKNDLATCLLSLSNGVVAAPLPPTALPPDKECGCEEGGGPVRSSGKPVGTSPQPTEVGDDPCFKVRTEQKEAQRKPRSLLCPLTPARLNEAHKQAKTKAACSKL